MIFVTQSLLLSGSNISLLPHIKRKLKTFKHILKVVDFEEQGTKIHIQ